MDSDDEYYEEIEVIADGVVNDERPSPGVVPEANGLPGPPEQETGPEVPPADSPEQGQVGASKGDVPTWEDDGDGMFSGEFRTCGPGPVHWLTRWRDYVRERRGLENFQVPVTPVSGDVVFFSIHNLEHYGVRGWCRKKDDF